LLNSLRQFGRQVLGVCVVCSCTQPAFADIVTSYPAYVRETTPLTQKLIELGPQISGQLISIQRLAAINHQLHLMQTNYRWERGESSLFSAQLLKTALDALDDAVQFWQDGNDLRYLIGENENYQPFNEAYITTRLKRVLDCIEDLKTLQTLRQTLDSPTLRYQIRPEFTDTRQPVPNMPQLSPDDSVLPTAPAGQKKPVTPSPFDLQPKYTRSSN
jgi:hypothetical protein